VDEVCFALRVLSFPYISTNGCAAFKQLIGYNKFPLCFQFFSIQHDIYSKFER